MGPARHAHARLRFASILVAAAMLVGCGKSNLATEFQFDAAKQLDIDNLTLSLFKRSPLIDSGDPSLTAANEAVLEVIPRTSLVFNGLHGIKDPIASDNFTMYESPSNMTAPAFYDWAGVWIPVKDPAFQGFMAYHHATKAKEYAQGIFADTDFKAASNAVLPVTIYFREDAGALSSLYNPTGKQIHLTYDSASVLPGFHIADEADTIYHEFGHALQDAMNKTAIGLPASHFTTTPKSGYNQDLDGILEALADFFAASLMRDADFLPYFTANAPIFVSPLNRTGTADNRNLANPLAFPSAYVREPHLDGRVVAGALNDFRRFLEGETVQSDPTCSSGCTAVTLSAGSTVSNAVAYDRVLTLAYRSYAQISTTITYFEFARILLDQCASGSVSDWCAPAAVYQELQTILNGRGLRKTSLVATDSTPTVAGISTSIGPYAIGTLVAGGTTSPITTPAVAEVVFDSYMGVTPFSGNSNVAIDDGAVDPCETIMIYPKFTPKSGVDSEYFDFTAEIISISSNFRNVVTDSETGDIVEQVMSVASSDFKVLGWVKAGESSQDLAKTTSSNWYTEHFGSFFAKLPSGDRPKSELGWLVQAPAAASAVGTATFHIIGRRYNASSISSYLEATITQGLQVTAQTSRFTCNR